MGVVEQMSVGAPDEKELKAIKKEGGKKGSEIAGAADMGGMTFMNCSLDSTDLGGKTIGEVERMATALAEMNRPVDPEAEEAKGGSEHVALEHQKTVTAEQWCGEIVGGLGGTVLPGATAELAKGEIGGGPDRFPIKLKDEALSASIKFLVKVGVFPDKDDDSEDEMVFGDDDFPCDQDEAPAPLPSAPAPDEKEQKAIKKEGGKKGSEIAGAADMCGMTFMNCSLDSMDLGGKTIGEVERMATALAEMNRPVDPEAEEAKGGSEHVAKALFSYGNTKTGVVCYVPEEHQKTLTADKWCSQIVQGLGGKVLPGASAGLAKGEIPGNEAKGKFPIKLKDDALQASIQYLVKIGVFPDKDDDSEDEMIFGDDDFPS